MNSFLMFNTLLKTKEASKALLEIRTPLPSTNQQSPTKSNILTQLLSPLQVNPTSSLKSIKVRDFPSKKQGQNSITNNSNCISLGRKLLPPISRLERE